MSALPPDLLALASRLAGLTAEERAEALGRIPPSQQHAIVVAIMAQPLLKATIGATAALTPRQMIAEDLLNSASTHCMLFGGSRSGKTFLICRNIAGRAIKVPSRHAILRFRFSHLHTSVIEDTWPKVLQLCFPNAGGKLDRQLWVYRFDNGSEVWFGGLDEKERTEKILGSEFASIFLNECSQIPLSSRKIAVTRLAQNTALPLKMFYDCNPPSKRHWSHVYFVDKIDPDRHQPLVHPEGFACLLMNPEHNRANLKPEYLQELETLDERRRQRFLLGLFSDDDDTALWTPEMLDNGRLIDKAPPDMQRVIVAVDPSGCSGPEDIRSDEVGIIVVGLGTDGRGYVLEDLSLRAGPDRWKTIVASAYDRWRADAVVAETNYGGSMVGEVIRTAVAENGYPLNFREVTASRGKAVRGEPIAALFSQGRISLVGRFQELEYQLAAMTTAGYRGDKSPDRADAMIWGLSALFPAMAREAREAAADSMPGPRRHREIMVHSSLGSYRLENRDRRVSMAPPPPPPVPAPPPVAHPWPPGVTRKRYNSVTGKLELIDEDR
jgi:predicted phage terminase large subunit-like protein